MVWKLLLTLAVLGTLLSLGDCLDCSTDSDCKSVCGTCENSVCSDGTTCPNEGDVCNISSGKCEKTCASEEDCKSVCGTCDSSTFPSFCVNNPDCNQDGYGCNSLSYKCEKLCTSDEDCTSEDNCEAGIDAACGSIGFCQPCPLGLSCFKTYQNKEPPRCLCTVAECKKKCAKEGQEAGLEEGQWGTNCCSKDATTCSCCNKDDQTCYQVIDQQAKSSSWELGILHMEKAKLLTQTCQNICTEDSTVYDVTCEKCRTDPNNSTRSVCMPCSAFLKCNTTEGEKACCTDCGCVCCEAGQTCTNSGCQCTEASCSTLCGTCDNVNHCNPGVCDEGQTCKRNFEGGFSCW